jgi:hypothetical protein
MKRWIEQGARAGALALAALMILGVLGGCPQSPKPDKTKEPPTPTRPMQVGEVREFEFAGDGRWHPSPFRVLNNHVLAMRPVGESEGLSEQAIRFKVGQIPQMLRAGERVRITIPGALGFKVDSRFTTGLSGPVTVEVKRIK